MNYNFKTTNDSIINDLEKLKSTCDYISENSKAEYIKSMPPTQNVIPKQYIYTKEAGEQVKNLVHETKQAIKEKIKKMYNVVAGDITKAPTQEALNVVEALKMRNTISAEEMELYMDKYSDNYQIYGVLKDIAKSKNVIVRTSEHPQMVIADNLKNFEKNIEWHLSVNNAVNGRIDNVMICAFEQELNNIVPE